MISFLNHHQLPPLFVSSDSTAAAAAAAAPPPPLAVPSCGTKACKMTPLLVHPTHTQQPETTSLTQRRSSYRYAALEHGFPILPEEPPTSPTVPTTPPSILSQPNNLIRLFIPEGLFATSAAASAAANGPYLGSNADNWQRTVGGPAGPHTFCAPHKGVK